MTTFASVGHNAAGSAVWILANSNGRLEITNAAGTVLEIQNVPNSTPPTGQIPAKNAAGTDFLLDWTLIAATPDAAGLSLGDPAPAEKVTTYPSAASLSLGDPAPALGSRLAPSTAALSLGDPSPTEKATARPSSAALSLGDPAPSLARNLAPSAAALSLGDPSSSEASSVSPDPAALGLEALDVAPALILNASAPVFGVQVPTGSVVNRVPVIPVNPTAVGLSLGDPAPTLTVSTRPSAAALGLAGPSPTEKTSARPSAAALSLGDPAPHLARALAPAPAALGLAGTAPGLSGALHVTPAPVALELSSALALGVHMHAAPASLRLRAPADFASVPIEVSPAPAALELGAGAPDVAGGNREIVPDPALVVLEAPAARVRNLKRGGLRARSSTGLQTTGQARFSLSTVVLLESVSRSSAAVTFPTHRVDLEGLSTLASR